MSNNENLRFEKLKKEDVSALTKIMTDAFNKDAEMHIGAGKKYGPPGYDNGKFIIKWGLESNSESFTIYYKGKIIGAVILWINEDNINFLGNIFIDPNYEGKGFGTKVWKLIEEKYTDTVKWMTETPGYSRRNHSFYVNKCGFKIVKIDSAYDFLKANYLMEKEMK